MATDVRIKELPVLPPGTSTNTLIIPVYDSVTDTTYQLELDRGQTSLTSNVIRGSEKIVAYYDSTYFGVPQGASTLDRLTQDSLALGTVALVLNPSQNPGQVAKPPHQYALVPAQQGEAGALEVYADADPATTALVWAKWVPVEQLATDGLAYFDENTTLYPAGSTVKYLAGTVRAFEAKQQIKKADYPGGKIPAPDSAAGAGLWNEIFVNGGSAFTYISANQYGTHPEFKSQASLNAYLLGAGANAGTPPTAPFPKFDAVTRILTATHALGDAEIEFSTGGYYSPYQPIQVDALEHKGGSWLFRTRGIPGRPASAPSPSPYIAPVATTTPGTGTGTGTAPAAPTIVTFGPSTGAAGTSVTISGSGFVSGGTAVKFGSLAAASVTFISATQLEVVAPANVATGKLSVTTAGGTATSAQDFTVGTTTTTPPAATAPTIVAFSPTSGAAGTAVTIAGTGFISGGTSVKFGSLAAASTTFISTTQLEVVAPAGVVTGKLSVTTAGGTVTSGQDFTVATAPATPKGYQTTYTDTIPADAP